MVVDWERLAELSGKLFILFLEYCIKLSAVLVTGVVLAAEGTFWVKLGTGFSSVSSSLRKLFGVPSELGSAYNLVYDYNSLSANMFYMQHGNDAIESFMAYLNGGVAYLQTVNYNFGSQPFATFFAAVFAFFTLYLTSQVLRFYRQKGEGSYFNKMERKLGEYIFKTPEELLKPELRKKPEPKKNSEPERSSEEAQSGKSKTVRKFGMNQTNNEYLEDYIRQTQNGDG